MTTDRQDERCESTRVSGARCTRPAGHDGPHWQDNGGMVIAWANDSEPGRG